MTDKAKAIYDRVMDDADQDRAAAADALCDGEYLQQCGYSDADQEALEEAYEQLQDR